MIDTVHLELPCGAVPVSFIYLGTYNGAGVHLRDDVQLAPGVDVGSLAFLHKTKRTLWRTVMDGRLLDDVQRKYDASCRVFVDALTKAVPAENYDVVMAPPSTRLELAAPYLVALQQRFPGACDLTAHFQRESSVRAGYDDTTVSTLVDAITFDRPVHIGTAKHALFVDDVFAKGKSAAAIFYHLRQSFGDDLKMTVVCPLRVVSTRAGVATWGDADQ